MGRSLSTLTVAAALVVGALVMQAPPARACSCSITPLAELVEAHGIVFVGEEISRREVQTSRRARMEVTFRVDTLYKGEAGPEVVAYTGFNSADCGVGPLEGPVGVLVWTPEGGEPSISSCGSIADPVELRAVFEGVPAPTGAGPAAFLVGSRLGDARVMTVDAAGGVVAYGRGDGRLAAAAACPGGERVVELVVDGPYAQPVRPRLDIRNLESMEVEASWRLSTADRRAAAERGMAPWVQDLECHDANASLVTALRPRWKWDKLAAADLVADGAEVDVWREGERSVVPVGAAKALAVDPDRSVMYTVEGRRGHHLAVWDLSGELIAREDLPGSSSAWDVALGAGGAVAAIPARFAAPSDDNLGVRLVDRVLLRTTATGTYAVVELPTSGGLQATDVLPEGIVVSLRGDTAVSYLVDPGGVRRSWAPPHWGWATALSGDLVMYRWVEGFRAGLAVFDVASGEVVGVTGTGLRADAITALPPRAAAPPASTTTTWAPLEAAAPTPTTTVTLGVAPEPADDGLHPLAWFGGGALLGIAVLAATWHRARRRPRA